MSAKFGIGSVSEFTNAIYENTFKSSGLHEISFVAPFYMGSTYITDYPAELYLTTDASGTVIVDGWYIRILRKNINIITVDYTVPDATNLVKGIVRLGGDLAGTADSPTVPGLTTKVPTTRTIGTTSPLLGGGDLSSNLTLSIQQGGSTQNGYLSSTDWIRFDEAHNDRIVSAGVTGTTTKTLTLNQHDGGTVTASWTDNNTDAVTSVFGRTGAVVSATGDYTTTQVTEGTNLYYTNTRVSANTDVAANTAARHSAVTIGTANGLSLASQTLSLALASTSTTGALSSTNWNTFNGKQNALSGTGIVKSTAGVITYLTDNTANWDDAYNNKITTAAVTGTTTKTLTLNQQDGGTVTASWTDKGDDLIFSSPLVNTAGTISIPSATGSVNGYLSSTDWTTFNTKQGALNGTGFVKVVGTTVSYDNSTYALDNVVVKLTGDQTIAGNKTFSSTVQASAFKLTGMTAGSGALYWASDRVTLANYNTNGVVKIEALGGNSIATFGNSIDFTKTVFVSSNLYANGLISRGTPANTLSYLSGSGAIFIRSLADETAYAFQLNTSSGLDLWSTNSGGTSTRRLTLDSSGNLGIGTTSPDGVLTVAKSSPSSYVISSIRNLAGGVGGGVQGTQLNFYGDVGYAVNAPTSYIQSTSNDGGSSGQGSLRFGNYNGSTSVECMRITSGGNVGIGTTTVPNTLSVGMASSTTGKGISLTSSAGIEYARFGVINSTVDNTSYIGSVSNNNFAIYANNAERMRISQTGNVLINTTTDGSFRLDVQGSSRFNGLQTIQGTTASDTAPLGSELAAVTGTGTGWTLAGTDLNVGGYTHTTGDVTPLTTTLAAVSGTYYQIAYTITGRTSGSITINYGGTATSGITATGATGPLASSTAALNITPTTDFNGTVVLSIKTIGTSSASVSYSNSAGTITNELRINNNNNNLFLGIQSGRRNSTGINNSSVSPFSLNNNTTGSNNTAFGVNSLSSNTTASSNTAFGVNTLTANTTGSFNSAFGLNSLRSNTTGQENVALGRNALEFNTTANSNTAVGVNSLTSNTTGGFNSAFGSDALNANITGSQNIAFGYRAGRFIADGTTLNTITSNSIFLGLGTKALANNQTNQIVIGHNAVGLGSNTTVLGNSSTTATAIYGDLLLGSQTDNGTDKLQVTGTVKVSSSVQVGDNATAASATNVGAIRYRSDANNSYMDMVMQTGASTYAWVNVVQNNW